MAARMAGHVEHAQLERRLGDAHVVSAFQAVGQMLDRLAGRSIDRHGLAIQQIGHSADVVLVMVGE
jgi:hypothetical protein